MKIAGALKGITREVSWAYTGIAGDFQSRVADSNFAERLVIGRS
jgi:hypothetical protein